MPQLVNSFFILLRSYSFREHQLQPFHLASQTSVPVVDKNQTGKIEWWVGPLFLLPWSIHILYNGKCWIVHSKSTGKWVFLSAPGFPSLWIWLSQLRKRVHLPYPKTKAACLMLIIFLSVAANHSFFSYFHLLMQMGIFGLSCRFFPLLKM